MDAVLWTATGAILGAGVTYIALNFKYAEEADRWGHHLPEYEEDRKARLDDRFYDQEREWRDVRVRRR